MARLAPFPDRLRAYAAWLMGGTEPYPAMVERLALHWGVSPAEVERQDRGLVDEIFEVRGVKAIFETPAGKLSPVERSILEDLLAVAPVLPRAEPEPGAPKRSGKLSEAEFARRAMLSRHSKLAGEK